MRHEELYLLSFSPLQISVRNLQMKNAFLAFLSAAVLFAAPAMVQAGGGTKNNGQVAVNNTSASQSLAVFLDSGTNTTRLTQLQTIGAGVDVTSPSAGTGSPTIQQ